MNLEEILATEIERLEKNHGTKLKFCIVAYEENTLNSSYCTSPISNTTELVRVCIFNGILAVNIRRLQ
jgi:hypothetical protein